jgi:hypothetical protein
MKVGLTWALEDADVGLYDVLVKLEICQQNATAFLVTEFET